MFGIQTVKESSCYSFSFLGFVAGKFSPEPGGGPNVSACVCGVRAAASDGGEKL